MRAKRRFPFGTMVWLCGTAVVSMLAGTLVGCGGGGGGGGTPPGGGGGGGMPPGGGGGGGTPPGGDDDDDVVYTPQVTITDDQGQTVSEVREETRASVATNLTGLPPGKAVEVTLYKDGQPVYVDAQGNPRGQTLTADASGAISNAVLFYDLGIDPETGLEVQAAGTYTVHITGQGVNLVRQLTVSRGAGRQGTTPVAWVTRSGGRFAIGSVPEGEPVFAKAVGLPASTSVHLYVVQDKRNWKFGDVLTDMTSTTEEVTTTTGGTIAPPVQVWGSAAAANGKRDFDLVVDVDKDGKYSDGDAIDANLLTGFTVQGAPQGSVTEGVELACDGHGTYKNTFTDQETVHVWVNPPSRRLTRYRMVKKYVVVHKDAWSVGDALIDVTGRPEWDLVRYACSNQYVSSVWSPKLTPGKYDVVIDVNQNDVLDEGDLLDGGSAGVGFVVEGPVPKRVLVSANPPIVNPGQASIVQTQVINENDAPLVNVTVNFAAGAGGTLSAASARTNADGVASVTLTAGAGGGVSIPVTATVTVENVTVDGKTTVDVRSLGSINALIQ